MSLQANSNHANAGKRQLISRMLGMISLRASRPTAKRVTKVRFCCMAVAASNPSINGSADFALSACAAIRPQRSATALINRHNAVCKTQNKLVIKPCLQRGTARRIRQESDALTNFT
jgi:hypothetical protein